VAWKGIKEGEFHGGAGVARRLSRRQTEAHRLVEQLYTHVEHARCFHVAWRHWQASSCMLARMRAAYAAAALDRGPVILIGSL